MATLCITKHVNAAPQTVFTAATDLEHLSGVCRQVERIEVLTPGPMAAGTKFRETRTILGRAATEEFEVAHFDPPREFVLTANSCGARYVCRHRFVPDISGTLVELLIETTPQTLLAKLTSPLGRLFAGSMRKMINSDLEDLKNFAEGRSGVMSSATHGYKIHGA